MAYGLWIFIFVIWFLLFSLLQVECWKRNYTRIDYYEVQVKTSWHKAGGKPPDFNGRSYGKFLFSLNQIVSLSWLYFVKSNCFVLQIELSIYVGFCLLSKSISSDELAWYIYTFLLVADLHDDQDHWRSSNRDASTSNFPSKAASSVTQSRREACNCWS